MLPRTMTRTSRAGKRGKSGSGGTFPRSEKRRIHQHLRTPDRGPGPDTVIDPIYLDHAATTPLRREVLDAMMPWLTERHGNPSSVHGPGRRARSAVEDARHTAAEVFGVEPGDIVFTSGGTESDNMALRTARRADSNSDEAAKAAVAVSRTEHDAIVRTAEALERNGGAVLWMETSPDGTVPERSLQHAVDAGVVLVSLMHVNNETGALNDLAVASRACRAAGTILHTDAVQSAGYHDLSALADLVDLISISAHKIGGPKGVGMLVRTSGDVHLEAVITGGRQERDLRAGTENVAGIVGAAEALRLAADEREHVVSGVRRLRERLKNGLLEALGETVSVNTPVECAPHILNVLLKDAAGQGLDGEMLVLGLDVEGVLASTGSACSSGTVEPSRVLLEMGVERDLARGAVRFSLGPGTTEDEIDRAVDITARVARRIQGA